MRLRFTTPALADLKDLRRYITSRSPQGARRVRERIRTLIERLPDHPFIGKLTEDPTIRRLNASPYPYLIFYEVAAAEIIIHAVRHGARNPSTMPGQPDD